MVIYIRHEYRYPGFYFTNRPEDITYGQHFQAGKDGRYFGLSTPGWMDAVAKRIYDDRFCWKGWGGRLRLGSGVCRLRIFDLTKQEADDHLSHLKPIVVVASDTDEGSMSIRSCASHIATQIVEHFNISPSRMLYIEYAPSRWYGESDEHHISEVFDSVVFTWRENRAINPRWQPLSPSVTRMVKNLLG